MYIINMNNMRERRIQMIIYSDGALGMKPITPAHRYVFQHDFTKILEDIDKGEIPCGSGQPFPVEFANPDDAPKASSWSTPQPTTTYQGGNVFNGFIFGDMR